MKLMIGVVLALVVCMVTGCTPIKGYPGPELPDTQLSIVDLAYNSEQVDVNNAAINKIEFGSSGIKILPGAHTFDLDVTAKDPPLNCTAYPSMDYSGYFSCQERVRKHGGYCDCYDYLTVYERCYRQVQDGSCDGNLKTLANARYNLSVQRYERSRVDVRAQEIGTGRTVGTGTCAMRGWRSVTEENYIGTGRSNAYQYGIYGCG